METLENLAALKQYRESNNIEFFLWSNWKMFGYNKIFIKLKPFFCEGLRTIKNACSIYRNTICISLSTATKTNICMALYTHTHHNIY